MLNKFKKIGRNVRGFTLVEVMIGMMILTVAIVSATNLLTGIIDSNRNNLTTLQAYYLSQEGLEMVRNIRDTNWLHNRDWLGKATDVSSVWGGNFEVGKRYVVEVVDATGGKSFSQQDKNAVTIQQVSAESPWRINNLGTGKIYRHGTYLDSISSSAVDSGFKRTIFFTKYDCSYLSKYSINLCADGKFALVQSKVEWDIGAKHRDLTLSEVLTNWKGGAL